MDAAASPEDQDRTVPTGETPFKQDNSADQPLSPEDERIVSANPCPDAANLGPSTDVAEQTRSSGVGGDLKIIPPLNDFATNEQVISYGGYGTSTGNWDGYPQYLSSPDGLHVPVIYNDNASLMFHSGYGYNPEIAYGQYSNVATHLPSIMFEGQLYSPQQIPFSPSLYPQRALSNVPSSGPLSSSELMASENNGDNLFSAPESGYLVHFGSFGGGNISQTHGSSPLTSPSAYPQPMGILGPYEQHIGQRPFHGYGSTLNSSTGHFQHGGSYQSSSFGTGSISNSPADDRQRSTIDKSRRRERVQDYSYSDSFGYDRNRGPRASRVKGKSPTEQSSTGGNCKDGSSSSGIQLDSYNRPDFIIDYRNAKFFIIKSFSEDNIHKSIKYGVWASTPHGNKKLDAAYHKAKEEEGNCPVFLLFSVNASGQFCGVAEMIGPVDFDKNADYWQQDRWSGQFPVRWHIIKDVPNSRFRHILLENNDNKPVTHSRDSQEVKLEHGIEMLKIFKNHQAHTSILDDFAFYDQREKTLKARQAKLQDGSPAVAPSIAGETVNKMSAVFAAAVKVDDDVEDAAASKTGVSVAANSRTDSEPSLISNPAIHLANESQAAVSSAQNSVNQIVGAELEGDQIKFIDS